MKKQQFTVLALAVIIAVSVPAINARAATTSMVEGAPPPEFAASTSVEPVSQYGGYDPNIDRSKNSQLIPPSFGSQERNYPADRSNFLTPGIATYSAVPVAPDYTSAGHVADELWAGEDWYTNEATSTTKQPQFTTAVDIVGANNVLGTLKIPVLGLSVTVYECESLENLAKGVGHFSETSAWLSNVAIAGHNRGAGAYFGQINTLVSGDIIEYTTSLGTRQYSVVSVERISETDRTGLAPSTSNQLTLITCVRDVPELRWQVVAVEIA